MAREHRAIAGSRWRPIVPSALPNTNKRFDHSAVTRYAPHEFASRHTILSRRNARGRGLPRRAATRTGSNGQDREEAAASHFPVTRRETMAGDRQADSSRLRTVLAVVAPTMRLTQGLWRDCQSPHGPEGYPAGRMCSRPRARTKYRRSAFCSLEPQIREADPTEEADFSKNERTLSPRTFKDSDPLNGSLERTFRSELTDVFGPSTLSP